MSTSELTESEFVALISENQGIIHKVCRMYQEAPGQRQDLFQEIVLQLWRSKHSFKGDAKITTWMYRVALNTAISGFRKSKRRPKAQELSARAFEIAAPTVDPDLEEKRSFLFNAIEQLSDVEKAIIMLFLEEHSYDEIAAIIGITRNHVGVKINRIKTKLKKMVLPHFQ